MKKMGVIEGFFGPQWPDKDRKSYADFLSSHGGSFYIYAPKQDQFLRKAWREIWSEEYIKKLTELSSIFRQKGVKFGIGFSPFGLGSILSEEDKVHLQKKLEIMNKVGIDLLGLFFDDMPINDNLADTQITVLNFIQKTFKQKIIFCPSYYSLDPILDKVFGQRPKDYLEDIAAGVSQDVTIAWTGPKVISPEINSKHLLEVSTLLKRKPFIWENFFANDGPRNCKFLKLRAYSGRDEMISELIEGFGFNLMNQPQLSKISYLSSKWVLEGMKSEESFDKALGQLCSVELKEFIKVHQTKFLSLGLDQISEAERDLLINELKKMQEPLAIEIRDWLLGIYNVGSECLTD